MNTKTKLMAVVGGVAAIALLAGCSTGTGSSGGKIELSIQTFGQFGYEKLITQYEKLHPNITVKAQPVADANAAEDSINTHLAAGSGMPDVVAVESGFLPVEMQYPDKWLPVASSLRNRWLPWKSEAATDKSGTIRFYGVDAGPAAVCYNSALLKAAGFPSDAAGFTNWIGNSWDSFYSAATKYTDKTGKPFFDSANSIVSMKLAQTQYTFEDKNNKVIAATNPDVKAIFDSSLQDSQKLSAGLAPFSTDWNTGVAKSAFAVTMCPSWAVGLLQSAAPQATGWTVADVLPGGGANRGGSYLGVSTQSKHPKEAQALATWLTAPAQEIKAFQAVGSFPSQKDAYTSEALLSTTSKWASNSPVGKIFVNRAKEITTAPYRGPQWSTINNYLTDAVTRVETGTMSANKSWSQFQSDVKNNTK